MEYNAEATRQLESIYQTDDAVARRSTLLNALRPAIDEHVIDIGTGPGFVASEIADRVGRGGSITGVDNSDASLRLAKNGVSIRRRSAFDMPMPPTSHSAAMYLMSQFQFRYSNISTMSIWPSEKCTAF